MATNIVSALGGGAGFDSQKLVTDLVNVQKEPLQLRIDNQKKDYDAQISAYGVLKSSMSELQGILSPLANPDTFNARAVNVPTTDVLSVNSLKSTAQPGTYKIEVEQVAAAQSLAFNVAAPSSTAALGKTGELTFKVGQWAYAGTPEVATTFTVNADKPSFKVQVDEADSLTDIAKKINDAESNVKASVLLVDGVSQLMITSESGEKNALEITTADASLSDFEFKAGGGNTAVLETQTGQDAKVKLNGLDVSRDSNEIDDVIPGFSFTLNKADLGNPITFSITEDRATAETAIKDFVDGYNLFFKAANELVGVKTDEETNATTVGNLAKDGTAKSLLSLIRQTVGSSVPGLDKNENLSALTNVGIRTKRDGTLEIIEKDFRAAFDNNFEKVATLFSQSTTTSSNAFEVNLGSYGGDAKAGKYDVHISQAPTKGYLEGGAITFPIDASSPVNPDDYGFKVLVNGTTTGDLKLEGTYANATELAADLQSIINGDTEVAKSKSFVDVTVETNGDGDEVIRLTSRDYGSASGVRFETAGTEFADKVKIADSTATTVGKDVAGTINGVAGFGSGDLLLAPIDTDSYGLNLKIKEGTASGDYSFNFSRGFAGELANLSERFLGKDGIIDTKEKSIQKDIKGLETDQTKLDRRMTAYQERLSAQFIAMERVVASLNSTKSQLDGLVDRLPFTAKS
jgi:flagellar hook-associated protein 2